MGETTDAKTYKRMVSRVNANYNRTIRYFKSGWFLDEGETDMKDRLEKIIKDYMVKQFGNEDVLPKPVLTGLAEEINNHRWEIHTMVQEEYDMEDIEEVAKSNAYELTDDEKSRILHRYKKLEDSNLDLLYDIVEEVYNERGEN